MKSVIRKLGFIFLLAVLLLICGCWWFGDPDHFIRHASDLIYFEEEQKSTTSIERSLGGERSVVVQGLLHEVVPECAWFSLQLRVQVSHLKSDVVEYDIGRIGVKIDDVQASLGGVDTVKYLTNNELLTLELLYKTDTCGIIDTIIPKPLGKFTEIKIHLDSAIRINGIASAIDTVYAIK